MCRARASSRCLRKISCSWRRCKCSSLCQSSCPSCLTNSPPIEFRSALTKRKPSGASVGPKPCRHNTHLSSWTLQAPPIPPHTKQGFLLLERSPRFISHLDVLRRAVCDQYFSISSSGSVEGKQDSSLSKSGLSLLSALASRPCFTLLRAS